MTSIVVTACTVTAAAIDLRARRVPNALTCSSAVAGILLALTGAGRIGVAASIAGGLIGLGLMLPGYLFGGTGGGDVKLLAAVGTILGPDRILTAFIAMAVAGGIIALAVAVCRGRLRNQTFAYAPAIAIGAVLAAIR